MGDDLKFKLMFGGLAIFVVFVIFACVASCRYSAKLNAQCLADGRTEYECYSMIYGRGR